MLMLQWKLISFLLRQFFQKFVTARKPYSRYFGTKDLGAWCLFLKSLWLMNKSDFYRLKNMINKCYIIPSSIHDDFLQTWVHTMHQLHFSMEARVWNLRMNIFWYEKSAFLLCISATCKRICSQFLYSAGFPYFSADRHCIPWTLCNVFPAMMHLPSI